MTCPECGTETVDISVPDEYQEYVPGTEPAVGLCPHCLSLTARESAASDPDFARISDAFPTTPDSAIPMALLVGLLDNLALYRSEISTLLAEVERAGVDPLLVLDRLAHDRDIDTELDLAGRRTQLEQLL
jgi:hypothetical protein